MIKLKSKAPKYLFGAIILIGLIRIFQGFMNHVPVGHLFIEIIFFSFIYFVIYYITNETAVILKETLNRIKSDGFKEIETEIGTLQNFAQHGNQALKGFGKYMVLAGIFAAYPVSSPYSTYIFTSNIDSGSSDGSENSGCSDGGSSGCGSSGCGGCGGGD